MKAAILALAVSCFAAGLAAGWATSHIVAALVRRSFRQRGLPRA
jgi:F0F1-type ATP synthase membrane subunit c/vacuolar-type H+-ATPase subunit K